jgi:hypothetical protein
MRKKIIFVAFCLILFLILTTLSYGWGPDPKYDRLREDPWQRCLSPGLNEEPTIEIILIKVNSHFIVFLEIPKNPDNDNVLNTSKGFTAPSKQNLDRRKEK